MARMFTPPHPGLTLRDDVLPALGLTVTQAAKQLDVSRVTLSRVLNARAAISPEMALRIEAWLGAERGGDARVWLDEHQVNFTECNLSVSQACRQAFERLGGRGVPTFVVQGQVRSGFDPAWIAGALGR